MIFLYYSTVSTEISKNISCRFYYHPSFSLQVAGQVLQDKELWVDGYDCLNHFF